MNTSRLCLAFLFALLPVSSSSVPSIQQPTTDSDAIEELIAEKDPRCPAEDEEDVTSPDGRRVAWRAPVDQKWTVMVNGVPQGTPYDAVKDLYFSPDGRNLVYFGRRDKRWTVVVDGHESSEWFDDLRGPSFHPKTSQPWFAGKRDKRWHVLEGGKVTTSSYADIRLPAYSEDGEHVAFRAKPAKNWVLVVDGVPQKPEFDEIVTHRFSPDGKRIASVAERNGKLIVVVDGLEGPAFDIVGGLRFSLDSRRFGYAGANVHQGFGSQRASGRTFVDGVATAEFEGGKIGSLLKNALSMSVPHLRRGYFDQLHAQTHGVTGPVFSPDAARVAYGARLGDDAATVYVDGKPGATYRSVLGGPVFSHDSRRVAFIAESDDAKAVVIDDRVTGRLPRDDSGFVDSVRFAPDNERVISVSVKGGTSFERGETSRARRRVYVDTIPGVEHNARFLGEITFTAEGQHLIYMVGSAEQPSGDASFIVVDGIAGKGYDDVFFGLRVEPDQKAVSYTARTGRKFYFVRQPLRQTSLD